MNCLRLIAILLLLPLAGNAAWEFPLLSPQKADSLEKVVKQRLQEGMEDKGTIHLLKVLHRAHASKTPRKANEYIELAMELAIRINDKKEIATIYNYLGNLYRDLGLPAKALDAHLKSLELSRSVPNDTMIAYSMNDVGNIYYDMRQWDQALSYYRSATALSKKIDFLHSHAVSLNNIGLVHEKTNNLDSALYYHQLALKDRQLLKDRDLIAHSHMYLGIDYRNLEIMDDAMQHMETSLAEYRKVGNVEMVPVVMELIAETYQILGQNELAEAEYLGAYKNYQKIGSHINQAELGIRLGAFYMEADQLDTALMHVQRSIALGQEQGLLLTEINATKLLAEIQKRKEQPLLAMESLERYNMLKDSFNQYEFSQKIGLIEAQSNISDKEQQIAAMEQEQMLREEALTAKETTNRILYGIIAIVFILALIILYAFYHKARANRELQEKNKIIESQNQKIEANNRDLQKAKEIAEQYSQAKTEFLSNISHEFRTPMHGIVGLTDILLDKGDTSGEERKNLESIRYSAKYLLNILNEVLDLSKIESGKIDFNSEPFNVEEMVNQLVETHKARIDKPVMLNCSLEDVPAWIKGDATRLYQILNNLVGNALKFTDKGFVRIEAGVTRELDHGYTLRFSVQDTGVGMSQEQLKKVFNRFEQADSNIYKKYGGTGLGLSITKRLVEMQGGALQVESELEVGTTFTFELPFEKVPVPADNATREPKKTGIRQGLKVLYAEDNEINQFLLRQLFKEEGIELDFAEDGQQAVDLILKNYYDVVLMDIQMPVMDGIEATQKIRKMNGSMANPSVPIIGFTADVMADTKSLAMEAGMDYVMLKPFEKDDLLDLIASYTSS